MNEVKRTHWNQIGVVAFNESAEVAQGLLDRMDSINVRLRATGYTCTEYNSVPNYLVQTTEADAGSWGAILDQAIEALREKIVVRHVCQATIDRRQ